MFSAIMCKDENKAILMVDYLVAKGT